MSNLYSLEDYESAKNDLKRWTEAWGNYSGNNPNKYKSDIKSAERRVRVIETHLKEQGLLEMSEQERLEAQLDKSFPKAKSKEIVEFEGKKYRRRFFPLEKSRSRKTVAEWGKSWELVTDE